MLPLTRNERTPQDKVAGMRIAYGQASWGEMEGGGEGYVFPGDKGFVWEQDENWLRDARDIQVDALIDCIRQVEEQLGSPDSTRDRFGLFPTAGHSYLGLVTRSRVDERVCMTFTPTAVEASDVSAYFEWYLDDRVDPTVDPQEMAAEVLSLAQIAPDEAPQVAESLPGYQEAGQHLMTLESVSDGRREAFLERLWRLEKTLGKGLALEERRQLLAEWKSMIA